ncbi:hypothetical protein MK851_09800 [Tenacibaculum sp. 1B UA]|uniref:hypothetical protein n=1 Tax=Tenacibaculum sp. 1B UA TaxID=2922252 RepID=UPI002A23B25C|nr:hypothetical protein [Tenacibaculum sp. 1B UA]MDX8553912.1 hypothetical protein [Tenacibaculum sp. 1B UA]
MIKSDFPLYSQILVALLSIIFLIIKKTRFLKILTLFLVVTSLVELVGAYYTEIMKPSFFIYHYYTFFEYVIIYFLFEGLVKDKKRLNISRILLLAFVIMWGMIYYDKTYLFYSMIVGSFNVGVLAFLYLRELLLSNEIINYKKLLPFWVSVGLLVFHLPAIPFFSFFSYMKNRNLFPILHSLIFLMNIIISFGLLWSNKKAEY